MKNFVLSLITLMTIGTTVCFGKTNKEIVVERESPRRETVQQRRDNRNIERRKVEKPDSHGVRKEPEVRTWRNTTVPSMPIKKSEVTISVQSLHF